MIRGVFRHRPRIIPRRSAPFSKAGNVTVSCSVGALSLAGQLSTVVPGGVVVAATTGGIVLAGQGATIDAGTLTWEQEGFRFRNDDGSETTATWLVAQDTNISWPIDSNIRLRMLANVTGNPDPAAIQIEFRKVGGSLWKKIDIT